MEEKRSAAGPLSVTVGLLLILLTLYVGAHFALKKHRPFVIHSGTPPEPQFKLGGEAARIFFWPVWKVLLWFDDVYWKLTGDEDGS